MAGSGSGMSRGSSEASSGRKQGYTITGVPKRCWCGDNIVTLISKSSNNPCRRYFRCGYAASNKLINDNHVFKWVDDALLNEIDSLATKNTILEQELSYILVKVEDVLYEAKASMKKTMLLICSVFLVCLLCLMLVV